MRDRVGERLLELVEVMDRLRSPGGCPWDAQQTHETLAPYLVEEAHELLEAIDTGDRAHLAEELGDVLLQVVFHARVASEHDSDPFDIDDVAAILVAKLIRRHPHVFADVVADTPAQVVANWEDIKAAEKPERTGPLDGIPASLPPLERATKVVSRLTRAGRLDALDAVVTAPATNLASASPGQESAPDGSDLADSADIGTALLALVARAHRAGVDPSAALRAAMRDIERVLSADPPA